MIYNHFDLLDAARWGVGLLILGVLLGTWWAERDS